MTSESEIFLNGVVPTPDTITSLGPLQRLRVWDPVRNQEAFVFRTGNGALMIETGDIAQTPEQFDIRPEDALEYALTLWHQRRSVEAHQQQKFIENASF